MLLQLQLVWEHKTDVSTETFSHTLTFTHFFLDFLYCLDVRLESVECKCVKQLGLWLSASLDDYKRMPVVLNFLRSWNRKANWIKNRRVNHGFHWQLMGYRFTDGVLSRYKRKTYLLLVKEPFSAWFPAGQATSIQQMIFYHNRSPFFLIASFFLSVFFFKLLYKKVIQKYPDVTFKEGIFQLLKKKVLLHNWSCMSLFSFSLSLSLSLFR